MQRKLPTKSYRKPARTISIWQLLFDAADRSPAEAKASLMHMRTIGLLDDIQTEFLLATLALGDK